MAGRSSRSARKEARRAAAEARARRKRLRRWLYGVVAGVLTLVIAPLVVFVAGPLILDKVEGDPTEQLDLIDLGVRNDCSAPPQIDVTLRNRGEVVSVVKEARFRIRAFAAIEASRRCYQGAGYFSPSGRYELRLPETAAVGETVSVRTSQRLVPNEADKFVYRAWIVDDNQSPLDALSGPSRP